MINPERYNWYYQDAVQSKLIKQMLVQESEYDGLLQLFRMACLKTQIPLHLTTRLI